MLEGVEPPLRGAKTLAAGVPAEQLPAVVSARRLPRPVEHHEQQPVARAFDEQAAAAAYALAVLLAEQPDAAVEPTRRRSVAEGMQADIGLAQRLDDERFGSLVDAAQVELEPPSRLVMSRSDRMRRPCACTISFAARAVLATVISAVSRADAEPAPQGRDGLEPQAVPRVARILVGRVFVGALAELLQQRLERAAPGVQQRPHQQKALFAAPEPPGLGNAREAARTGAAQHAEQYGLEVVVGVVAREQQTRADFARDRLQRAVSAGAKHVLARTAAVPAEPPHRHGHLEPFTEVDHVPARSRGCPVAWHGRRDRREGGPESRPSLRSRASANSKTVLSTPPETAASTARSATLLSKRLRHLEQRSSRRAKLSIWLGSEFR
jgi:hypothetical protein